jgi:hypothetical protein
MKAKVLGRVTFMMMMMMTAMVFGFAAQADDDITGQLEVATPFRVIDKKGRTYEIETGSQKFNIDMDGHGDDQQLKLNFKEGNAKGKQAILDVPSNVVLPRDGGELTLAGKDTGQAFDIWLKIQVDTKYSEQRRTTECCRESCNEDGTSCSCYGSREILYRNYRKTFTGQSVIRALESAAAVGQWGGTRKESGVVYDYVGSCI